MQCLAVKKIHEMLISAICSAVIKNGFILPRTGFQVVDCYSYNNVQYLHSMNREFVFRACK